MRPSNYVILVIIAFFALVLHSIHLDEKRRTDRRKRNLRHPVERRKADRRKSLSFARIAWVLRSQWHRKHI